MKRLILPILLALLACQEPTDPDLSTKRAAAVAGAVTLAPSSVASIVGDKDTVVGTASCLIAWRLLDSTKIKLLSTFKGPGQTRTNSAVVQSLAVGTTGLRGGCSGAADTTTFTITVPQPPPPGDSVGVQAAMADSFVKTTSVQTHFGTEAVYINNFATLRSRLIELGVRHIRQRVDVINAQAQSNLAEIGDSGITLAAGCWPQGTNYTSAAHCPADLDAIGIGRIYAVDGWNEVDAKFSGTAWTGPYVQFQTALFNTIHGDATWGNTPVFANSLAAKPSPLDLPNISGIVDFGNMHPYPGGAGQPSSVSTGWIPNWNSIVAPKPLVATETGYHTCPTCTNGVGVDSLAQGKYLPRTYAEYWNRGVGMTNLYELADEGVSTVDREQNWGLLRNDLSRKPSFRAIRDMLALLKDEGANFAPGKLNYTVTNGLGTTHQFLLQKRSGVFFLVIWQELNVYNTTSESDISNPDDALTVTLGRSRPWKTYKPRVGGVVAQTSGTGTSINLSVPDEVMLVEIGT